MDEQLVEVLRRRGQHGDALDAEAAFQIASAAASGRRHRHRRTKFGIVVACAGLAVGAVSIAFLATGSGDSAKVAIAPRDGPGLPTALQFRPVLANVAPADPAVADDEVGGRAALASCAVDQVAALGQAMPTSRSTDLDPHACVVLELEDSSGSRLLLGPSSLDASGVATARKSFQTGNGWGVDMTLTPAGSTAFDDLARKQFHAQFAVVADGVVVTAPTVEPADAEFRPFGGTIRISIGDTEARADAVLRAARGDA